jgi:hypothetical protein
LKNSPCSDSLAKRKTVPVKNETKKIIDFRNRKTEIESGTKKEQLISEHLNKNNISNEENDKRKFVEAELNCFGYKIPAKCLIDPGSSITLLKQ